MCPPTATARRCLSSDWIFRPHDREVKGCCRWSTAVPLILSESPNRQRLGWQKIKNFRRTRDTLRCVSQWDVLTFQGSRQKRNVSIFQKCPGEWQNCAPCPVRNSVYYPSTVFFFLFLNRARPSWQEASRISSKEVAAIELILGGTGSKSFVSKRWVSCLSVKGSTTRLDSKKGKFAPTHTQDSRDLVLFSLFFQGKGAK